MKVTVLTENTVYKRGFLAEHGLSLLIETAGKTWLFDTGQSGVFLQNAVKMKENLEQLEGIILSHGHYDHCGGMKDWAKKWPEGSPVPVYMNGKGFERKYSSHPVTGHMLFSGIPEEAERWMKEKAGLVLTEEPCHAVSEHVYLLSSIPRKTDFEKIPATFWKETHPGAEPKRDTMEDEQLLVIRESQGLCVFSGCAHAGIVNCLNYVRETFPGERIHSLVAGMHLKGCSSRRLQETVSYLKELEADLVVPLHCTGLLAAAAVKEALGESCVLAEAGKKLEI